DPTFASPRAWLGYVYVIAIVEDWQPEKLGSRDEIYVQSEQHARDAIELEPYHYDGYWALTFVLLNAGRYEEAREACELTLLLNGNGDKFLLTEAADYHVHFGEVDHALTLINRSMRIYDWQKWVYAWAYYMKGKDEPQYYQRAIDEIEGTFWKQGDKKYLYDIQLLLAASHARLAQYYGKGAGSNERAAADPQHPDAGERSSFHQRAAGEALSELLKRKPGWSLEKVRAAFTFQHSELAEHWYTGVKLAGLSEE
ncbi:MAG: hypothetical protein ACR2PM_12075, partial [Hyphomicrobiales bacterium]